MVKNKFLFLPAPAILFFIFSLLVNFTLPNNRTGSVSSMPVNNEEPSPVNSPEKERNTFQLAPDLKIELVASEPMVQDPVVIQFDPDGRLWVVEMRGFMPDMEGRGEKERVGRISVLFDTNCDGQMDSSVVYLDSLILPRALALVTGGALVAENNALWFTQDIDGDLKADRKILIDSTYANGPSPEHSGNGLLRNIDNWYYNAKSRFRYRMKNGQWLRDSTEFRGQWGISNDDEGRLYYNYNWSQLHADLVPPNYFSRNQNHTPTSGIDQGLTLDRRIYPIRPNPAVNRGYVPGTLDSNGRLLEFTAACSPLFFRGSALPDEYYGNVFVCEPAGNLVKRNLLKEEGLSVLARDASPGREFLASTDERFRPVCLSSGPDGALYVADMYRGLIQHSTYITPYLREQTIGRNLVQPVHLGRIWRIVPEGWKPAQAVKYTRASADELVTLLTHPNGWQRDMAQRLLVERGDRKMEKLLKAVVKNGASQAGRLQALWTLEGIGIARTPMLFSLLRDSNAKVGSAALRMLEPQAASDTAVRRQLQDWILNAWADAPFEQQLQMVLTATVMEPGKRNILLSGIAARYDSSAIFRDAILSSLQLQEISFIKFCWNSPGWKQCTPSGSILLEMLSTAVIHSRDPAAITSLLSILPAKDSIGWKDQAVLTAITIRSGMREKPVKLLAAPSVLKNEFVRKDQRYSRAISSLFEWPGQVAVSTVAPVKNALGDNDLKQFVAGRQLFLTICAGCHGPDGGGLSRFAPPLAGSEWVSGNEKRLILVLLHGLEGPVDVRGKHYDAPEILPVMPAHSTLDDRSISAILTYIRNAWNNTAGPVSTRTVGNTRNTSQGRVMPWTAPELNRHVEDK